MSEIYIHETTVHNTNASSQVVPELIKMFHPKSVLDVGCGTGTWLRSFLEWGVNDVAGMDGDFVNRSLLHENIAEHNFIACDLTAPFNLGRKFDIVISLEVAEHLPASSAAGFIHSLALHGDTIIFSAALPGQGGQNHINEQWKDYWISYFAKEGYKVYDLLRPLIWNNLLVDWWYKQNILVFSKSDLSHLYRPSGSVLEVIHPELFKQNQDYIIYLQEYVRELEAKLYPSEK